MARVVGLDAFQARLRALPAAVQAEALAELQEWAPTLTGEMATRATWADRTGNARRGLHAWAAAYGTRVVLYLAHGVPYGVFLELGHQGRFAILWPTLRAFRLPILASLRTRLERRFGGKWTATA